MSAFARPENWFKFPIRFEPMLRFSVLLLVLLNGVYFAWSHDWLRTYGFAPERQTESQRLAQQIRPEAVRVLSPRQAQEIEAQRQARAQARVCWQAGPFETPQVVALRRALDATLPPGSWALEAVEAPVRWLVYMGQYAHADMVARKQAELAVLGIKPQPLNNPGLEPGLSLGMFDTQAQAQAELQALNRRGIRTARVLPERPATPHYWLRIPAADEALRARLDGLKGALVDRSWQPCP